MRLPPELIRAAPQPLRVDCNQSPIQAGLGGSPWHVAVASMLLCRAKRNPLVTAALFERWPIPWMLSVSGEELIELLRPLGMHRVRARQIQLLSHRWDAQWSDLREMAGVGRYVAAAVELFCFGCTENAACDHVLHEYAKESSGPRLGEYQGRWFVDGDEFATPAEAYAEYVARRS